MRRHRYRITIRGHLGLAARGAFDGLEIVCADGRTDITAELDQAALFGLLAKVQSLALELVEVHRDTTPVGSSDAAGTGINLVR